MFDYRVIAGIRLAIPLAGALLLAAGIVLRRMGKPMAYIRLRDAALVVLGVAAFETWWNFGRFHFDNFIHPHEHFHYFLGSKYSAELGYTRLYECTVVADLELGFQSRIAKGLVRDLTTNELEPGWAFLNRRHDCRSHFTDARWAEFKKDLDWFRTRFDADRWQSLVMDHGYNATPVWAIAGAAFASLGPATNTHILALALLDPLILVVMFGCIWWAFGWRTMCVALIFWGTNYPARFFWTGGAFLRTDWLASLTIGVCLARRGRFAASGVAVAYSALLRLFPALMVIGVVLNETFRWWQRRAVVVSSDMRRWAAGGAAGAAALLLLTIVSAGGFAAAQTAWSGFLDNSEKHAVTFATNQMGLKTVIAYEYATRGSSSRSSWVDVPWDTWIAARRRVFSEREPLFWILVVGFMVLLAAAVRRQQLWVAMVLGVGLLPVAWELTCYYYAFLLVFALLWTEHEWIGVALCALSASSNVLAAVIPGSDDLYAATSVAVLLFVAAVTGFYAVIAQRHAAQLAEPASAALDA
jgi:hypothetical protein